MSGTGVATDGDTFSIGANKVRLWGVDGPESAQQGWNRQGVTVPVGQQSTEALASALSQANVILRQQQGKSYGRIVAPATVANQDLGQQLVREGNAFAAPSFVAKDPDYRFQLMQAERLARLNRLGPVHDNFVQPPAEHRANPGYVPSRETVAQFFDTPTPIAGMRPEAEARYVQLLNTSSSPDEIAKFVESEGGFKVDRAAVTKWIKERDAARATGADAPGYATYTQGPQVLTDTGTGASGAAVRGVGQGFAVGGLDELGAFPDMIGLTAGRENVWNSDRRLADIWSNNQQQNASILGYDHSAHPVASTVGQVAGAVTSGFAIPWGAGARTIPQLARVGAAYGGAEGFLGTEGGVAARAQGAAIGAPVGAAVNAAGGKALEYALPQMARAYRALMDRRGTPVGVAGDAVQATAPGANQAPRAIDRFDITPGNPMRVASEPQGISTEGQGLGGWAEFNREGSERFLTYTGPDGKVANVHLTIGDDGASEISVDPFSQQANRFGPAAIRQAARDLRKLYPEITTLNGERLTGAGPGRTQSMAMGPELRAGRERDYINLADAPPPPPGFRLDEPGNDNMAAARAIGMDAEPMPSLSASIRERDYIDLNPSTRPQPMDQPLSEAQTRAITANVQPADVLPLPSNQVASIEEAARANAEGRFAPVKAPNERDALTRQSVRNWQGQEVPTVGPVDLVGFLRLNGGLVDQGGELATIGIVNNAPRRGLSQVGQETRFGPILNGQGMNLDDAALRAWEAGYFPEHADRPDINTFLEAVRETYNGGSGRRFRAEDQPQLEAFDALQAERFALEQQRFETGQPVYQDRSAPADEPPPFPPIEAYEEWPADAVQWAGNINLAKLETPQDISRALVQMNNRVGFDAATRGRVTHAETERLAADIGMTADDLLKRRNGQALNAEEALAARQILAKSGNELVNLARKIQRVERPGDEEAAAFQRALVRHAAIQEQVAGMTAEAGRALSQFRMMASSRAVPGEVLSGIVDAGGGPKRVKESAELILEAIEDTPGRFNTVVRKAASPRFSDKLAELYINNLLSGPQTHVVNAISNTLTSIAQIPENAFAAALGGVRRGFAGEEVERVMAGEVGARLFGLIQGAKEGAGLFAQALKTGETSDTFSKIAGNDMRAISGIKGEIVRIPGRLLNSADELFKGISRRAEINALAYRQAHNEGLAGDALKARIADLSANPTEEIEQQALEFPAT
jgi:endonuclease YncB( thermonuclease family)